MVDNRRMLVLSGLIMSIGLVSAGVLMLSAGIDSLRARSFVKAWQKSGGPSVHSPWRMGYEAAVAANARYPVPNAQYSSQLAEVLLWRHSQASFLAAEAISSRKAAINALHSSLASRPVGALERSRMAYAMWAVGEDASAVLAEYSRAFAQSGWGRTANYELAKFGIMSWVMLDEMRQDEAVRAFQRAWRYPAVRDDLWRLVMLNGLQYTYCERGALEWMKNGDACPSSPASPQGKRNPI